MSRSVQIISLPEHIMNHMVHDFIQQLRALCMDRRRQQAFHAGRLEPLVQLILLPLPASTWIFIIFLVYFSF